MFYILKLNMIVYKFAIAYRKKIVCFKPCFLMQNIPKHPKTSLQSFSLLNFTPLNLYNHNYMKSYEYRFNEYLFKRLPSVPLFHKHLLSPIGVQLAMSQKTLYDSLQCTLEMGSSMIERGICLLKAQYYHPRMS
jgi:hypothetical protein